jgi:hypothetical protein
VKGKERKEEGRKRREGQEKERGEVGRGEPESYSQGTT